MVPPMTHRLLRLPLLLLAAHAGGAAAQYKCTASDGAVTFQQTPCVGAKSEQKLNVVPNGHPPPASGAAAPVAGAGNNINKRMLAGYERQRERDALVQALSSAQEDKARRAGQRQADIAAARQQFGGDPANAQALREALASIESRYKALDEIDDNRVRTAQRMLAQWDKATTH
jgi:hypothetical protein